MANYEKMKETLSLYLKFQAVIKSAASAASQRGGRASGRLDHGFFDQFLDALAPTKIIKKVKRLKCGLASAGNPKTVQLIESEGQPLNS